MAAPRRLTDLDIPAVNDPDRIVRHAVLVVSVDDGIEATVAETAHCGPVTRIDTYGDTTDVERDIQFRPIDGHQPADGWELWRAYIVEEPSGVYRMSAQETEIEGSNRRSIYLEAPDDITVIPRE